MRCKVLSNIDLVARARRRCGHLSVVQGSADHLGRVRGPGLEGGLEVLGHTAVTRQHRPQRGVGRGGGGVPEHARGVVLRRLDHAALGIEGLLDVEDGEHVGDGEPEDVVREVAARADAAAEAERLGGVGDLGVELAVLGEEAGGVEDLRVGVTLLVTEDGVRVSDDDSALGDEVAIVLVVGGGLVRDGYIQEIVSASCE